jgi:hypothetical protein
LRLRATFGSRPFTVPDAQTAGISVDRLRQACRWGLIEKVRRGWYAMPDGRTRVAGVHPDVRAPDADGIDMSEGIDPGALATARELIERGAQPVFAGSLASTWWGTDEARAHGTRAPALMLVSPGCGIRRGLRHGILIREATVDERDIVRTNSGLAFTSATRTGIDCARGLDPASAFIVVNSAVRRSLDPRLPRRDGYRPASQSLTDLAFDPSIAQHVLESFAATLDRCGGHGLSSIRRVMDRIDVRLESALESLSWWRFCEHGIDLPTPQQWIRGASGKRYRVDFDFGTVIGEADGLGKYTDAGDLRAEKRRQMDIELGGRTVVRWGWPDMWNHPERVIAALARAAG